MMHSCQMYMYVFAWSGDPSFVRLTACAQVRFVGMLFLASLYVWEQDSVGQVQHVLINITLNWPSWNLQEWYIIFTLSEIRSILSPCKIYSKMHRSDVCALLKYVLVIHVLLLHCSLKIHKNLMIFKCLMPWTRYCTHLSLAPSSIIWSALSRTIWSSRIQFMVKVIFLLQSSLLWD